MDQMLATNSHQASKDWGKDTPWLTLSSVTWQFFNLMRLSDWPKEAKHPPVNTKVWSQEYKSLKTVQSYLSDSNDATTKLCFWKDSNTNLLFWHSSQEQAIPKASDLKRLSWSLKQIGQSATQLVTSHHSLPKLTKLPWPNKFLSFLKHANNTGLD